MSEYKIVYLYEFVSCDDFGVEYAIRRVHVNQDGLKLNGTYQLLVYADDVNILWGRVHTINKNAEALIVASKEIGIEVNTDKTNYMGMSWEQKSQYKDWK